MSVDKSCINTEIQLYECRSKRNLQALLFEVLDLMKFYMVLIGMALECLWSRELKHMHRRSTVVPVQPGNLLGKLVLLGRWSDSFL